MRLYFFILFFLNYSLLSAQYIDPGRDFLKGRIVDMRGENDFKKGHIEGSINITFHDLKMVIQSGGFVEFHNLCVIMGISPERKVYIIPDDKEPLFNAFILAGALNYIGINEVFILRGTLKDLIDSGVSVTNKGSKINFVDWTLNYAFNFLDIESFKKLSNQKNKKIINFDDKLEKNKNYINIKPDMLFQNNLIENCEGINKLIFTGKGKEKKDIILKSSDILMLLGMKYLLSNVCGYDNVFVVREERK